MVHSRARVRAKPSLIGGGVKQDTTLGLLRKSHQVCVVSLSKVESLILLDTLTQEVSNIVSLSCHVVSLCSSLPVSIEAFFLFFLYFYTNS